MTHEKRFEELDDHPGDLEAFPAVCKKYIVLLSKNIFKYIFSFVLIKNLDPDQLNMDSKHKFEDVLCWLAL